MLTPQLRQSTIVWWTPLKVLPEHLIFNSAEKTGHHFTPNRTAIHTTIVNKMRTNNRDGIKSIVGKLGMVCDVNICAKHYCLSLILPTSSLNINTGPIFTEQYMPNNIATVSSTQ